MTTSSLIYFPHGTYTKHVTFYSNRQGGVVCKNGVLYNSTGPNAHSISVIRGYLPLYVNQESRMKVTLNVAFADPCDGMQQILGMGDFESGVFVGFDGLRFGFLNRTNGIQQHWTLTIGSACTASGQMTLVIFGTSYHVPLTAGMSAMIIMQAVQQCVGISDDDIASFISLDRLTLYTLDTERSEQASSIDFGTTGVTGNLSIIIVGKPCVEQWMYKESFNRNHGMNLDPASLNQMNVYEFCFSQWSSGSITFSMMDLENDMQPLHVWRPDLSGQDSVGFNTSIPYNPHVCIQNIVSKSSESNVVSQNIHTLRTSMATISSGLPDDAIQSVFNTSFKTQAMLLSVGSNSVISVINVPLVSADGIKNRVLVSIKKIGITLTSSDQVYLTLTFQGFIDVLQSTSSVQVVPYSSTRVCNPSAACAVSGGLEVSNELFTQQIVLTPQQLWLASGTQLVITACSTTTSYSTTAHCDITWTET
jgi:hypothetical protein